MSKNEGFTGLNLKLSEFVPLVARLSEISIFLGKSKNGEGDIGSHGDGDDHGVLFYRIAISKHSDMLNGHIRHIRIRRYGLRFHQ